MTSIFSRKKIICLLSPIALGILSMQAHAIPGVLPKGWHAHPPIHLKSPHASLTPLGMSPAQIKKAYGFPAALQGLGQTIAIVDAMDNPNVESDLNTFSTQFGLPACTTANGCFSKVYSGGTQPAGDTSWGLEMSLDVQWAHAIAPQAKIILVETPDADGGLYEGILVAIQHNPTVISLSWGGPEFSTETAYDTIFSTSPVPIVVASGDSGNGLLYPAASPYVLSAGGTQITLDAEGNYVSETAWSGSGGGISAYETEPSYQSSFPIPQDPQNLRGVPDVAYNASPATGYSIYDSYGYGGWLVVGGTSASAPQWAALIAIINASRGSNFSSVNALLYAAAKSSENTILHDIVTGTNGSCGYYCQAQIGYDYVTGFGTPQAANLINYFDSGFYMGKNSFPSTPVNAGGVSKI